MRALAERSSVLAITHHLSTVTSADQILLIEAGQVVERGRHGESLALGGRYAGFWERRQQAEGWRLTNAAPTP